MRHVVERSDTEERLFTWALEARTEALRRAREEVVRVLFNLHNHDERATAKWKAERVEQVEVGMIALAAREYELLRCFDSVDAEKRVEVRELIDRGHGPLPYLSKAEREVLESKETLFFAGKLTLDSSRRSSKGHWRNLFE